MDCYYHLRHLFYYKVRHGLLQIATGITKWDGFITNCDRYYEVPWLLQIATVHRQLGARASGAGEGGAVSRKSRYLFGPEIKHSYRNVKNKS